MRISTATDVPVQAIAAPDVTAFAPVVSLCHRRGMSRDAERALGALAFLEAVVAAERAHRDVTGGRADD
jgi:hypothetical protein